MDFFVTFETSVGFSDEVIYFICRKMEKVRKALADKDYGDAFVDIGVIPTICSDIFWRDGESENCLDPRGKMLIFG